jgi:hypothetical protein
VDPCRSLNRVSESWIHWGGLGLVEGRRWLRVVVESARASNGLARVVWCLIIESGIWGDCSSTAIGGWIGDRLAVVSPRS